MIGVEGAARAGYVAKSGIYGLIGVLAIFQALGMGGSTSGGRGAVRTIASGPLGRILLAAVGVGLAGYVVWRVVQAVADPGGDGADGGWKRRGVRAFYLGSAVVYGLLALYALRLLLGTGGGGGDGQGGWTARLMQRSWGPWAVGAIGVGIVGRGVFQFVKVYTASFREKIASYELGPRQERWAVLVSRMGLSARGVVFGIIGAFFIYAGLRHDPDETGGLSEALGALRDEPVLLAGVGAGLISYAFYQALKARYRMIDV